MNYSDYKTIKAFCGELFSNPSWRDVVEHIEDGDDDFTVEDVRFIADDSIDQIQQEELSSELYILDCFNSSFLAGILGIDQDVIDAMQRAEAFEAVGKLIISLGKLEEVQSDYASADGYGHHFNGYDFGQEELSVAGRTYYVFDNH